MITSADILAEAAVMVERQGISLRLALSEAAGRIEQRRRNEFVQAQCTAIETIDNVIASAALLKIPAIDLLKQELEGRVQVPRIDRGVTPEQLDETRRVLTAVGKRLRETGS